MKKFIAVLAAAGSFAATPAMAQDAAGQEFNRVMVRGGIAFVKWNEGAEINVAGTPLPGTITATNNTGIEVDAHYFVTPDISIALAVGVPPTTTLSGAGELDGIGTLGTVTYGPGTLTAVYHVNGMGPIKPYLGAGYNYTIIFDTDDALLQDFEAKDATGPVLQAGFDVAINERFGIYFDAKKIFAKSATTWFLPTTGGLAPGTARVTLDPLVLNAGVSVRF